MNKYLKLIITILIVLFLGLYYADSIGYYDVLEHKKAMLTNTKIEEFEKDIQEGKPVDTKKYLEDIEINYRNNLTTTCSNISSKVTTYFKDGIESIFNIIDKLIGD